MKNFKRSMLAVLALGLVLFGCQPDNVDPTGGAKGGKSVAGAFDASHTAMDSICLSTAPVFFRNTAGSFDVDKCIGAGGVLVTCNGPQMKWGSLTMYSGYTGLNLPVPAPEHWLDVDFSLTTGWMCEATDWAFVGPNGITIDPNTGFPDMTGPNWKSQTVNPGRNQWKIALPVDSLTPGSFDMACRMSVLRLRLNGSPNEPTRTTLWMINENHDNTSSPFTSNNEYSLHYTPLSCIAPPPPACPATVTNSICEAVYQGITCSGNTMNTTTLTADSTGAGADATYLWSNGATSRSITVTPATSTAYTVTVKKGNCDVRLTTFDVNVIDASCVIAPPVDLRAEFCPSTLDVRFCQSFNIREYVGMRDGSNVNWSNVRFTYTTNGANNPTNPSNWKLTNFNDGQSVTAASADAGNGRGNVGRGEYRVYVYRVGQATYDDFITIRVSNNRASTVQSAKCSNNGGGGNCGNGGNNGNGNYTGPGVKVCHVPPGNPSGATTICVRANQLSQHVTDVCGANNTNGGGGCNSGNGGNSNGGNSNGGYCSHSGGSIGCGNGNPNGGHSGDKIGACNSNPCQ